MAEIYKAIFSEGLTPALEALVIRYPEYYPMPETLTQEQAKIAAQLTAAYVTRGLSDKTHNYLAPDDVDGIFQRGAAEVRLRQVCGTDINLMGGIVRLALETAVDSVGSTLNYRDIASSIAKL